MIAFCNILLVAVVAFSWPIVTLWADAAPSAGPDRAGAAIYPIVCFGRWICLGIVLGYCASKGAFTSPGGWNRGVAATLMLAVYFALEMVAAFSIAGRQFGLPEILADGTVLIPLLVPLPLAWYAFWWLNLRAGGAAATDWRWPAIWASTAIAMLGVPAAAAGIWFQDQREKDPAYQEQRRAAEDAFYLHRFQATTREMDPLNSLLGYTREREHPQVRALALEAVARRPSLVRELSELLESDQDIYAAAEASRYLDEMKPAPPPELSAAYRQFVANLLVVIRGDPSQGDARVFGFEIGAAVDGARALRLHDTDDQLREMASFLRTQYGEQSRETVESIEAFLAGR